MTEQRVRYLFERYFTDSCTENERLEFLQMIHEGKQDEALMGVLQECWDIYAPERLMPENSGKRVLDSIFERARGSERGRGQTGSSERTVGETRGSGQTGDPERTEGSEQAGGVRNLPFSRGRMRRMAAVAALVMFCLVSGYLLRGYFLREKDRRGAPVVKTIIHDVAPGGSRAILTLADGRTIVLDSAANGKLAEQGDVKVVKTQDGRLGYVKEINMQDGRPGPGGAVEEDKQVRYNTISTPNGGKYQVVLMDGTKVWLNAASTLVFPTAFRGATREVLLKGEGYFEVTHNAAQPFVVKVGDMKVDVLGTSFNIMAYEDEAAVRTTLVEGAVRIGANGMNRALEIGEQGVWDRNGRLEVIHDADVEEAVAWKNGLLQFHSAGMAVIMRQIARWYNVQVVYANEDVRNESFSGSIPSSENVSQVLKMLELTGTVHFDVTGQRITVRR